MILGVSRQGRWALLVVLAMLGNLMFVQSYALSAKNGPDVYLNGTPIQLSFSQISKEGRIMVPYQEVFAALGALAEYDEKNNTVHGTKSDLKVSVNANRVNEIIVVPLRAVAEGLGFDVIWERNSVYIVNRLPGAANPFIKQNLSGKIQASYISGEWEKNLDKISDGDQKTAWAPEAKYAYVALDLGSERTVESVDVAWFSQTSFEVRVVNDPLNIGSAFVSPNRLVKFNEDRSILTSSQKYALDAPAKGRYVLLIGHHNTTVWYPWVNVIEAKVWGADGKEIPIIKSSGYVYSPPLQRYAESDAEATIDGDMSTSWAGDSKFPEITIYLDTLKELSQLKVDWGNGNKQVTKYSILVSQDGGGFKNVVEPPYLESKPDTGFQTFEFPAETHARAIKLRLFKTSDSLHSENLRINELEIYARNSNLAEEDDTPVSPKNPTLLFKSGFEDGVAAEPPYKDDIQWWQNLSGSDVPGFSWPLREGDAIGRFQYIVGSDADINDHVETKIEAVTGHDGKLTQALMQKIKKYDKMGPVQSTYSIVTYTATPNPDLNNAELVKERFIKYWVKISPNFMENAVPGDWVMLNEYKAGDYRTNFKVAIDSTGTKAYWQSQGQVMKYDDEGSRILGDIDWTIDNYSVPVPIGEWFQVEWYFKASKGPGGRWVVKINGQTVTDYRGRTLNTQPIDALFYILTYTDTMGLYTHKDDFEIWDTWPQQ